MSEAYIGSIDVTLVHIKCGGCGVSFGLEKSYRDERKNDGQTWYCPNGCARVWRETEADRLREQLKKETARLDAMRVERDALAAGKLRAEKKLARVGKGTCPCCRRSFTNLRRHMATKHPELSSRAEVAAASKARREQP